MLIYIRSLCAPFGLALSVAQAAALDYYHRPCLDNESTCGRSLTCVRMYMYMCVCVESAGVRRLVAFGHRRWTGPDGKSGGGKGIEGRLQRGWLRGVVYSPCLGPAESRTKEKRVRSLSVRDEQRVPSDYDDNDGSFVREFLFLACHTDPNTKPSSPRARFLKDRFFKNCTYN